MNIFLFSFFSILKVICQNLRLSPEFNIEKIAACTPGFVGADLQALVREAAIYAVDWLVFVNHFH